MINRKVNDIQYFDFRNLDDKSFLYKLGESELGNLNIFDLEGTFLSSVIKKKIITSLSENKDQVTGIAFLGIGRGVRKLILQMIDFPVYIAEDKLDGEDWLLSL